MLSCCFLMSCLKEDLRLTVKDIRCMEDDTPEVLPWGILQKNSWTSEIRMWSPLYCSTVRRTQTILSLALSLIATVHINFQEFEQFVQQSGIKHIRSAPYHPSTNGLWRDGLWKLLWILELQASLPAPVQPCTTLRFTMGRVLFGILTNSYQPILNCHQMIGVITFFNDEVTSYQHHSPTEDQQDEIPAPRYNLRRPHERRPVDRLMNLQAKRGAMWCLEHSRLCRT